MKTIPFSVVLLLAAAAAHADASPPAAGSDTVCLPKQDFERFLDIALERQCLEHDRPSFQIDSITVLTDKDGRVFYTGADPHRPYALHMHWCNYQVEAQGKIELVAAMQTPASSGVRFRPKAYLGYLPLKLDGGRFNDGIDAGLLIDWLYIQSFNLNIAAGFRSLGIGPGVDLTDNFGLYAGYALGYTAPTHNLNISVYFAF